MGKSPSIDDLSKQNEDFNKFIAAATDNLKKRMQDKKDAFLAGVHDFYNQNHWDQQPLGSGEKLDYRQGAEFSMDSIIGVISGFVKALFSNAPVPEGMVLGNKEDELVAKAVDALSDFQILALHAATAFIMDALGAFDAGASTESSSVTQSKSLAPGLMLHTWRYGDSFHHKDFFNNEFIIENVVVVRLIYSFQQASTQADIDFMNLQVKEIKSLDKTISDLQDKINADLEDTNVSLDVIDPLQKRIDRAKENLEKYRGEVDALIQKRFGGQP